MAYKADMKWRSGKDVDAHIDRTIFELQVKDYRWTKVLSIRPRKCYWTGETIKPFSYAMLAEKKPPFIDNAMDQLVVDDDYKKTEPVRWVSMSTFVYLRLQGKL